MITGACCDTMARQLRHECSDHPVLTDCPDVVVILGPDGEIRMPVRDGGSSFIVAAFCPWCGTQLKSPLNADHQRWHADSEVLSQIGRSLFGQEPSSTVRIPSDLAKVAVEAWERDDGDEQPLRGSPIEERDRGNAAALALIGLAIAEGGHSSSGYISVELSAWQVGTALAAADRRNLLL